MKEKIKDTLEDFLVGSFIVLIFGVIPISFLTSVVIGINFYKCKKTAEIIEKNYKYSFFAGCFFEENGKFVKQNENVSSGNKIYIEEK